MVSKPPRGCNGVACLHISLLALMNADCFAANESHDVSLQLKSHARSHSMFQYAWLNSMVHILHYVYDHDTNTAQLHCVGKGKHFISACTCPM